ncbi:MAG: DUF4339 domain-containing protein, partial [Azospirillaceae bacterium]
MKQLLMVAATTAMAGFIHAPAAWPQDWRLAPTFGAHTIDTASGGFLNVDLAAGGDIPAQRSIGGNCVGTIANAPDFRVTLSGGGSGSLDMTALSNEDTTLVVRAPNGDFLCVDDSPGSLNPFLAIADAAAGDYHVWVGTYIQVPGYFPPATLAIEFVADGGRRDTIGGADETDRNEGGYYYNDNGTPTGPVTLAEIERQIDLFYIAPDTLMWRDGMSDWAAAETIESVAPLFRVGPPPLPPEPEAEEEESGPPPLPPGPDDEADSGHRAAIMAACRVVAETEMEGRMDEGEAACDCIVDRLLAGNLDDT